MIARALSFVDIDSLVEEGAFQEKKKNGNEKTKTKEQEVSVEVQISTTNNYYLHTKPRVFNEGLEHVIEFPEHSKFLSLRFAKFLFSSLCFLLLPIHLGILFLEVATPNFYDFELTATTIPL
jgi:hypothetical protein